MGAAAVRHCLGPRAVEERPALGKRSVHHKIDEALSEAFGEWLRDDEHSLKDHADQQVDYELRVEVGGQVPSGFAAFYRFCQRRSPWQYSGVAEDGTQPGVLLEIGDHDEDDVGGDAIGVGCDDLVEAGHEVTPSTAGVGYNTDRDVGCGGLQQKVELGLPPSMDGRSTNPGPFGSFMTAPIINVPNTGILSTDTVSKRPVVITDDHGNDSIAIRHIGYLSLTWDHRAFDGSTAVLFLQRIKQSLETWDWEQELA